MNGVKTDALNKLEKELHKELAKPRKVEDTPSVVNPYVEKIHDIFRHYKYDVQCVYNGLYEGFIFVAWYDDDKVHTKIINI